MKTIKPSELSPEPVEFNGELIPGVTIRWLIKREDGADKFAMRYFEVEKDVLIPEHKHPWEHEIFILEGKAIITEGDEARTVDAGTAVYIKPDAPHSYKNIGDGKLVFLCIIPYTKV
ncbi:MAG: cupin domain-containing protein [Caldisericaceae bacterium]